MVQHALDRGYEVVGVCREHSVGKLDAFKGRITVVPGATNDREVIKQAVAGCDGVLVVLVPRGVHDYSTGTAQAVLDHAPRGARLVFSCGWHITRDGQDVYFVEAQSVGECRRPARAARSLRRPRRSGGGVPAGLRQRHPLDRRARQRSRGGGEPGPAGVEPACRRPNPREQPHAVAWTSPCSWWRPSRTTPWSTRPRRSSDARPLRRSRTRPWPGRIMLADAGERASQRASCSQGERRRC